MGYRQTVVVENGPKCDEVEATVREFSESLNTQYRYVEQAGKSLALSLAVDSLGGDLVFFTDDDVRVEPHTLSAYAAAATGISTGVFFGGPTRTDYEHEPQPWLLNYLPKSAQPWQLKNCPTGRVSKPEFLGFNWAAFAQDIRKVGSFDPNRGPGASNKFTTGDETDLQRRLLSAGLIGKYVELATVWHYIPAERCSLEWAIDRNYRHGIEKGNKSAADAPLVLGYPLWIMRRWCKSALRQTVMSAVGTKRARFVAAHKHSYNRGMIRGVQLAARPVEAWVMQPSTS